MNAGGWLLSAIISVVLGLAVNECSELSPALARRIARWSAGRRYRDAARAEERAEELAAYINDRPGTTVPVCYESLLSAARGQVTQVALSRAW